MPGQWATPLEAIKAPSCRNETAEADNISETIYYYASPYNYIPLPLSFSPPLFLKSFSTSFSTSFSYNVVRIICGESGCFMKQAIFTVIYDSSPFPAGKPLL